MSGQGTPMAMDARQANYARQRHVLLADITYTPASAPPDRAQAEPRAAQGAVMTGQYVVILTGGALPATVHVRN